MANHWTLQHMKMIMIFLILVGTTAISRDLSAQAFSESSLWYSQLKEGTVLGEISTYSYASQNPQEKSVESRLRGGLRYYQKMTDHFNFNINGSYWAQFPKESWGTMDIESLFFEWENSEKSSKYFIRAGRVLPLWGTIPLYSPIRNQFPSFSMDPIESHSNGIVGLYSQIQEETLDFEVMLSPLFIPQLGGPLYRSNEQGVYYSTSRWAMPIYYTARIGTAHVPLKYDFHMPAISDIILKGGGALRLTIKDFYDQYRFSGLVMRMVDPRARMRIDGKLKIIDEHALEGTVDLYPEFYRSTFYALEGHLKTPAAHLHIESSYRVPDNPLGLKEYLIYPEEWSNLIVMQTKHDKDYFPQFLFGITLTRQFNPYTDASYKLPVKSMNNLIGRVDWEVVSGFSTWLSSEVSTSFKESVNRFAFNWVPMPKFTFSSGVDAIVGKEDTYWGYFRDQDRLWVKGSYAF